MTSRPVTARSPACYSSLVARHPPDHIGQVVRDDQRTARVDGYANRAAAGFAVLAKAGHEVDGDTCRAAVAERYEDHLVAGRIFPVPATVLAADRKSVV